MFISKKKKQKLDEELAKLRLEVKDLKDIVKTQELLKLRAENAVLKEKEQLISRIRFRLKNIAYLEEDGIILVKYEIPNVKVPVNENHEVQRNNLFYAINKLQLLPLDDLKKISALIDEIKNRK